MASWQWGVLLAPVGALIIFGGIALPIKWAIATLMPESWLKRQILIERCKSKCSESTKRVLEQADRHPLGWRHFIPTAQAIPQQSAAKKWGRLGK